MVYVWQLLISMCIGEAARIEMTHSWSDCDERSPVPDWVEVWTQSRSACPAFVFSILGFHMIPQIIHTFGGMQRL
jgi:hypothetical protein